MQNLHIIKIRYINNGNGAKIKLYSERFKEFKTLDYCYSTGNIPKQVANYLTSKDFNIIGQAEGKDCYYIITNTFEHIK